MSSNTMPVQMNAGSASSSSSSSMTSSVNKDISASSVLTDVKVRLPPVFVNGVPWLPLEVTVFTVLTDVAVRPPPVLEVMTLRFNRRLLFVDDEVSRSVLVV
jgi:hypothetical protein